MKKFAWKLDRLLSIRQKEEKKKSVELIELTEKMAAARGELLMKQGILQNIVNEINEKKPKTRMLEQELFLTFSITSSEQIKTLKEKIAQLELQQKEIIAEVLKIRQLKEGLEKLRKEAKIQFITEQESIEQKEIDHGATVLFVRNERV
ncbi:hypothetical protein ACFLZ8_02385 [Planctomycetota bacterium]